MSAFELSWFLKIDEHRKCGVKPDATLADSLPQIKTALSHSGVVSISLVNCPQLGSQRLQLMAENGHSVVTLGETGNQSQLIRGYSRSMPCNSRGDADVTGGAASEDGSGVARASGGGRQLVCSDAEKVFQIFEEFFQTGSVSAEKLN